MNWREQQQQRYCSTWVCRSTRPADTEPRPPRATSCLAQVPSGVAMGGVQTPQPPPGPQARWISLPSGWESGGKYLASDTIGSRHNRAGPQLTELLGGEQRLFDNTSHPPSPPPPPPFPLGQPTLSHLAVGRWLDFTEKPFSQSLPGVGRDGKSGECF